MDCLEEGLDKNVITTINYKLNQLIQCFSICVNFNTQNSPVSMQGRWEILKLLRMRNTGLINRNRLNSQAINKSNEYFGL